MKNLKLATLTAGLMLGIFIFSCKGKTNTATNSDTAMMQPADTSTTMMEPAPVQVSADDSLTNMAKDAVKDYPGVTASVSDGEVILTGTITREKLPKLMEAVSAMHPKKINNTNLTVK